MMRTAYLLILVGFFMIFLMGCIDEGLKEEINGAGKEISNGINKITNNSTFFEKKIVEEEVEVVESIEIDISKLYEKKNLSENVSKEIKMLERETFELINREREEYGLNPLKWNDEVAYVARQHSKYLASKNKGFVTDLYISHTGENGEYHYQRLEESGIYYFMSSAENLFGISIVKTYYKKNMSPVEYYQPEELPFIAVSSWMSSELHRENILTEDFDETGVGVAKDETGTNYIFTQIFIKRIDCGYRYGACCKKPGYYPYCLVPLRCKYGYCLSRDDLNRIDEIITIK